MKSSNPILSWALILHKTYRSKETIKLMCIKGNWVPIGLQSPHWQDQCYFYARGLTAINYGALRWSTWIKLEITLSGVWYTKKLHTAQRNFVEGYIFYHLRPGIIQGTWCLAIQQLLVDLFNNFFVEHLTISRRWSRLFVPHVGELGISSDIDGDSLDEDHATRLVSSEGGY